MNKLSIFLIIAIVVDLIYLAVAIAESLKNKGFKKNL